MKVEAETEMEGEREREKDVPDCDRHCRYYLTSRFNVQI